MDVRIHEVSSTVRIADAEALLTPQVLDAITRAVLDRLDAEARLRASRAADTRLSDRAARLDPTSRNTRA